MARKRRPYGSGSVFKRKNKFWIAYYSDGRLVREAVSLDRETAEKVLKTRQADVIRGKFRLPKTGKISFVEMAKKYLSWSKTNKRSWLRDAVSLKNLVPFFGEFKLSNITPFRIEQYKEKRKTTVRISKVRKIKRWPKNATINRELALLKHLFNLAIKWGCADFNPVKDVRFLKEEMKERILSPEEIQHLFEAADDELRPVIVTALHTGMRLGEIMSLKWSQVNFEAGFIQVEHTKNGKIRKIPMNSVLKKTLKNVKKDACGHVFMRNGRTVKSIRKPWEHALRRAGIEGCRFHDLRHNFATYALLHGADLVSLRDILGHFDINMTTRYAHSSERLKQMAVEPLAEAFGAGESDAEYSQIIHTDDFSRKKIAFNSLKTNEMAR